MPCEGSHMEASICDLPVWGSGNFIDGGGGGGGAPPGGGGGGGATAKEGVWASVEVVVVFFLGEVIAEEGAAPRVLTSGAEVTSEGDKRPSPPELGFCELPLCC